jgi:hypothetical protein
MNMMAASVAYPDVASLGMAERIRTRLLKARRLALRGERERARLMCAESALDWLPWICRDEELRQIAVTTLLHAHGYELLRRLLAAADGRKVRFVPVPPEEPQPHGIAATGLNDGTTVFRFADNLLDQPAHAHLVNAWSRQLVGPT